jgi:hypothetical protein
MENELMITTNSDNQPKAEFDPQRGVKMTFPGSYCAHDRVVLLSAAKAEELAIELNHAAKMMRGDKPSF